MIVPAAALSSKRSSLNQLLRLRPNSVNIISCTLSNKRKISSCTCIPSLFYSSVKTTISITINKDYDGKVPFMKFLQLQHRKNHVHAPAAVASHPYSFTTRSGSSHSGTPPKKERRKRKMITAYSNHKDDVNNDNKTNNNSNADTYFTPKTSGGDKFDSFDDYLKKSSLSPWVPSPDSVARRMLQLAQASPTDVHCDLGCGDGRVNAIALQHFGVKRTVGIDNDIQLLKMAQDRFLKIGYSCRFFNNYDNSSTNQNEDLSSEDNLLMKTTTINSDLFPTKVDLIYADLMMYLNQTKGEGDMQKMKDKYDIFSDCTVLTMFFVEDTLEKLRPTLEETFKGSGCRIVTNGYAIPGWEPDWVEPVLDLKIRLYVMSKERTF
jgi:hypothetical protein